MSENTENLEKTEELSEEIIAEKAKIEATNAVYDSLYKVLPRSVKRKHFVRKGEKFSDKFRAKAQKSFK